MFCSTLAISWGHAWKESLPLGAHPSSQGHTSEHFPFSTPCTDCIVAQMGFNSENRHFPSSLVYLPISSFLSPGLLCDTQSVVGNSNSDSGCYSEVECFTFILRKLDNEVKNHRFNWWFLWMAPHCWLWQLSA